MRDVEWRWVVTWEGLYLVSDIGLVYSTIDDRLVGQERDTSCVWLLSEHRFRRVNPGALVLWAFVGPRPEGMELVHLDGDAFNCKLSNLRWAHDEPPAVQLTEFQALEARVLRRQGWTWELVLERCGDVASLRAAEQPTALSPEPPRQLR